MLKALTPFLLPSRYTDRVDPYFDASSAWVFKNARGIIILQFTALKPVKQMLSGYLL